MRTLLLMEATLAAENVVRRGSYGGFLAGPGLLVVFFFALDGYFFYFISFPFAKLYAKFFQCLVFFSTSRNETYFVQ